MKKSNINLFKSLSEELDPEVLQRKFLLALIDLQGVGRGSIWIKREDKILCLEAVGMESENVRNVAIDSARPSIVGWTIEHGEMTIADPRKDKRHYRELEEKLAVKSSLILCFPLFLRDKTVYGAVQIIETSPEKSTVNLDQDYLDHIQNLVNIGSISLENAIFFNNSLKEAKALRQTLNIIRSEGVILGQSPAFLKVLELVRSYAATDYPVLITGESGTGKELAANRIHELSNRRDKPFLVQNCSAIPENLLESELFGHRKGAFTGAIENKVGLFEAADGGTVFLDEIGDMPVSLQARILRVIQNSEIKPVGQIQVKKVDLRIVSATNINIQQAVNTGSFRQDLFFRLSVLPLQLPPLRTRKEDIPLLFRHFMKREALKMGLSAKPTAPEAMRMLINYPWDGNIRELENIVRYLLVVVDSDIIAPQDLPFIYDLGKASPAAAPADIEPIAESAGAALANGRAISFGERTWAQVEKAYVHYLLEKHSGNVTRAAKAAALNRSTFASRMRKLNI
ncbi:MAG: sigma-54-dependent Fis family transcriptional regulator [Desulfobacterales bacterium]|nr:sigma-54-dependent Fis family transcriptional regulator [Desulfobacterales bacterium]